MSRYSLKEVDCILAFSGGADCVATLQWLLLKGKKPYIFNYSLSSNTETNKIHQKAIKQIKEWYDVPVTTWQLDVHSKNNGFADRERTRKFFKKELTWAGYNTNGANPGLIKWATTAFWINFNHPWINEIYWGYVYGGLLEVGDGGADALYNYDDNGILAKQDRMPVPMDKTNYDDRHKGLFEGLMNSLSQYGIDSQFKAPLAHRTKLDLFKLIPRPVQEMVITCQQKVEACGKCHKCKELEAVKKACAEGY